MDAINIALQLAFINIFVVVLIRYWREPRVVHRDLVLVFASFVALFAINIVLTLVPGLPRALGQLSARCAPAAALPDPPPNASA